VDAAGVAAVELVGQAQQQRAAAERIGVGSAGEAADAVQVRRALALVAHDLGDQRHLARPESGESGVEDHIAAVRGVPIIADDRPDLVQQRRRAQQLPFVRDGNEHPPGGHRIVQL
jgi:hypothetical protein